MQVTCMARNVHLGRFGESPRRADQQGTSSGWALESTPRISMSRRDQSTEAREVRRQCRTVCSLSAVLSPSEGWVESKRREAAVPRDDPDLAPGLGSASAYPVNSASRPSCDPRNRWWAVTTTPTVAFSRQPNPDLAGRLRGPPGIAEVASVQGIQLRCPRRCTGCDSGGVGDLRRALPRPGIQPDERLRICGSPDHARHPVARGKC